MKKKETKPFNFFEQMAQITSPATLTPIQPQYDSSNDIVRFEYKNGSRQVFPAHKMANDLMFESDCEEEAAMVYYMAKIM